MKGKKLYVVKVNGYWLGYAGLEAEISDCKLYQGDPSKVNGKRNMTHMMMSKFICGKLEKI
jgi:hypothetical protein